VKGADLEKQKERRGLNREVTQIRALRRGQIIGLPAHWEWNGPRSDEKNSKGGGEEGGQVLRLPLPPQEEIRGREAKKRGNPKREIRKGGGTSNEKIDEKTMLYTRFNASGQRRRLRGF